MTHAANGRAARDLHAPDDPLGPVDQDADAIRAAVCRLVGADRACVADAPTSEQPGSGGGGSGLASVFEIVLWVLFFALVAALAYVVVHALMTGRIGGRPRRIRTRGAAADAGAEPLTPMIVDVSREPDEWRREAEAHRAAGRFRESVRCRYRALVGDLARRGMIDEIPGRTSGEERTQIAAVAPRVAADFSVAADLFDDAWYGHLLVAEADVGRMEALEHRVLATSDAPLR
jgi:hypothetical protein